MEKISLYYKKIKLGELSFSNGVYFYNSLKGESFANDNYIGLVNYNLYNSNNLKSQVLFEFFKFQFLDKILKSEELLKMLNKNKNDEDFQILLAYAKIKQDNIGYNLKVE